MELDLPSHHFQPRIYGVGAWTENLALAYDLVALLKPQLLVELGTDRGESYFAFCQSVAEHDTGTRCFAIDTWLGDAQTGVCDEATFAEVSNHNRTYYHDFSTLMRCRFDDAATHFATESIDLLHIDGLHTEEAVRHDVEKWLPKLAAGGILLLHDVNVRTRNFGVWKIWEDLRARGRSFTFEAGAGLGVWEKPPVANLPDALEKLFGAPTEAKRALIDYYHARGAEVYQKIARHWSDGTIRTAPFAGQTIVQVFFTRDGCYRDEDSVLARVGHGEWHEVRLELPSGLLGQLRLDFVSPCTIIEIEKLTVSSHAGDVLFAARNDGEFARLRYEGDLIRLPDPRYLRLRVTGIDPQIYLPTFSDAFIGDALNFDLKFRVTLD